MMPLKVLALAAALLSTAACAASTETSAGEDGPGGGEEREPVASSESASLSAAGPDVGGDGMGGPALDLRFPGWDSLRPGRPALHELPRLGALDGEGESGRCAVFFIKVWDPARGKRIEIPVTRCN